MPSPVGHALGGLIVGTLMGCGPVRWRAHAPSASGADPRPGPKGLGHPRRDLLIAVVAAVAPDLDFLWGRHNMETHSLGAAVLAGLAVLACTRGRAPKLAAIVTIAWASHVLFDWLGSDTTPPLGVMALWPLGSDFYFANAFLFEAISRRTWLPNFWAHNLWAVASEVLMLGPPAVVAVWWRRRRG